MLPDSAEVSAPVHLLSSEGRAEQTLSVSREAKSAGDSRGRRKAVGGLVALPPAERWAGLAWAVGTSSNSAAAPLRGRVPEGGSAALLSSAGLSE